MRTITIYTPETKDEVAQTLIFEAAEIVRQEGNFIKFRYAEDGQSWFVSTTLPYFVEADS